MKFTVTHLGTATALLEIGSFRLITDPALDPPGRAYSVLGLARYRRLEAPAPLPGPGPIDAVLLSHDQHGDNFDTAGRALARTAGVVLTTRPAARRLGHGAIGLEPWQSHTLHAVDGSTLSITATPARHGPAALSPLAGPVIGFLLQWQGQAHGATWISGDTVLFEGVREVARRYVIGTALMHLGRATLTPTWPARYTFTATEAVAVAQLMPEAIVHPLHYQGWSHFREGRPAVEAAFAEVGLSHRLGWLPLGRPFDLGARQPPPPTERP